MPLSPALDDFGSADSIVDRRIGTAYQYVHIVALAIKEVKYVAYYMETLTLVAANMQTQVSSNLTGLTVNNPSEALISYPVGVTQSMVKGSNVCVLGVDGSLYFPGTLTFTFRLTASGLAVLLSPSAGANLQNRTIRWNLIHTPVI